MGEEPPFDVPGFTTFLDKKLGEYVLDSKFQAQDKKKQFILELVAVLKVQSCEYMDSSFSTTERKKAALDRYAAAYTQLEIFAKDLALDETISDAKRALDKYKIQDVVDAGQASVPSLLDVSINTLIENIKNGVVFDQDLVNTTFQLHATHSTHNKQPVNQSSPSKAERDENDIQKISFLSDLLNPHDDREVYKKQWGVEAPSDLHAKLNKCSVFNRFFLTSLNKAFEDKEDTGVSNFNEAVRKYIAARNILSLFIEGIANSTFIEGIANSTIRERAQHFIGKDNLFVLAQENLGIQPAGMVRTNGDTALHVALQDKQWEVAHEILTSGYVTVADLLIADSTGNTPLSHAVLNQQFNLAVVILEILKINQTKLKIVLLEKYNQKTLLEIAKEHNDVAIVSLLEVQDKLLNPEKYLLIPANNNINKAINIEGDDASTGGKLTGKQDDIQNQYVVIVPGSNHANANSSVSEPWLATLCSPEALRIAARGFAGFMGVACILVGIAIIAGTIMGMIATGGTSLTVSGHTLDIASELIITGYSVLSAVSLGVGATGVFYSAKGRLPNIEMSDLAFCSSTKKLTTT